ncbi:putative mitochondrial protein [Cucumis melo var. makuwa]|uniref:Mitochondrial protein n=1 Tax=Cucumis melo var. makuwa TaxID=1194695 RepID=A0A5D3C8X2_CUCMM|nr:putative mitochondrial protein [Cucumis melo var. makuwa]TYK08417.1 putative mitochondrial protein [Cucumis melo var. makuwa]
MFLEGRHQFGFNQTNFTPRAQACMFVGYLLHHRSYKCFHPPSRKYFVTMDVTFREDRPFFPVSHLQGESVSEESNYHFESTSLTPITLPDLVLIPCKMSENDKSDIGVLENMGENNSIDETKVRVETDGNEAEQNHSGNLDEYDLSLHIPIALRKDTRILVWAKLQNPCMARSREGISVSERKYMFDLLTEIGMLGCHPAITPIEFNCKLGNLDISYDVTTVSQFVQALDEEHMKAINRILRYLKTTLGNVQEDRRRAIEAYTDSNWAGSIVDRKFTFGYCTFVDSAIMLDLDSLGFNVKADYRGTSFKLRVPFPRRAENRKDVKTLVVEMLEAAKPQV